MRAWAIAALAAVIGTALGAQEPWEETVPLANGAVRQPRLEALQAGGDSGRVRLIRVYRWEAPIEVLARFYIQRIGGRRDGDLDSTGLRPGEMSSISYHLAFHSLEDQCADSGTAVGGGTRACTVWRRGRDKKRTLVNSRLGYAPRLWVERVTFQWFGRDSQGELLRWQAELYDSGLSDNWQHYSPNTQLTIKAVQVRP